MPEISMDALDQVRTLALHWGNNILWALVILAAGWFIAGWIERIIRGGVGRLRGSDPMLGGFFASLARWAVLVFTGLAVLGRLGVETTSVVAVVGAAGLAIGLALQGTLSNLAAGVMLLLFRPFKVGDSIEAGALAGTVKDLSLFHTELVTGDNILVIAPNANLWNAALRNLSFYATRKVEVVLPVGYATGVDAVLGRVTALVAAETRIAADPAPSIQIVKLTEKTAEISVVFWCAAGDAGKIKSDLMGTLWREGLVGLTA